LFYSKIKNIFALFNFKIFNMKTLEGVSLTRLSNVEFGQHLKSIYKGITLLGGGSNFVKDTVFTGYLNKINENNNTYDKGLLQILKSDETAKIVAADHARDVTLSALMRYLRVFELSEVEAEVLAHTSLATLVKKYKGIQSWNFEEESNGIDNLVKDLNNDKYLPSVTLLNMTAYITRITVANEAFKIIFGGRTQEVAVKEVYDVKQLRADMIIAYNDMTNYVLAMSKAVNSDEYNLSLNVINTVRKYYADLLAKRKPATKTTPVEPIPPMA
jgi:Family of unknown function (DUF6261)